MKRQSGNLSATFTPYISTNAISLADYEEILYMICDRLHFYLILHDSLKIREKYSNLPNQFSTRKLINTLRFTKNTKNKRKIFKSSQSI